MDPIEFPEHNTVFAKNQPQYIPVPAYRFDPRADASERVIFCWQLSPEELKEVNRHGVIWHAVATFGQPLQPQQLGVLPPPEMPFWPVPSNESQLLDPVENFTAQMVECATRYARNSVADKNLPPEFLAVVAEMLAASYLTGANQTANFLAGNDGAPGFTAGNVLAACQRAGQRMGFTETPMKGWP